MKLYPIFLLYPQSRQQLILTPMMSGMEFSTCRLYTIDFPARATQPYFSHLSPYMLGKTCQYAARNKPYVEDKHLSRGKLKVGAIGT